MVRLILVSAKGYPDQATVSTLRTIQRTSPAIARPVHIFEIVQPLDPFFILHRQSHFSVSVNVLASRAVLRESVLEAQVLAVGRVRFPLQIEQLFLILGGLRYVLVFICDDGQHDCDDEADYE